MERLTIDEIIEHCDNKIYLYEKVGRNIDFETEELTEAIKDYWEHKQVKNYLDELREYRKLEEQGLLLRLPCKAGDTVHYITDNGDIYPVKIVDIDISSSDLSDISYSGYFMKCIYEFDNSDFDKTVFLTREEAEEKLKEKGEWEYDD